MSHNMAKIINPFLGMQERGGDWSERCFNPCWGTLQLAPFCCRSVYNILACVRQYMKVVRGGHASSRRQSRELPSGSSYSPCCFHGLYQMLDG